GAGPGAAALASDAAPPVSPAPPAAHIQETRPLREDEGNLLNGVDLANQSIVTVVGYPMRYGPPRPGEKLRRLIGSAVVLDEHRLLTTASMALPGGTLSVLLGKGSEHEARLLGVDRTSNLALFEIDGAALPGLRRAQPQSSVIGSWVAVVSNVAITRPQAALGRVVGRGERVDFPYAGEIVEIDAPTYVGSTGAAVLNEDGEWIAIVVGRAQATVRGEEEEDVERGPAGTDELAPQPNSVLLALPVDQVDRIVSDLAAYGAVRQAFLGVGLVVGGTDSLGVRVVKIWSNSPAEKAGIRVGDRILAMEGREMTQPEEITSLVRSMHPGDEIALTILRDVDIIPVKAVLGVIGGDAGPTPARAEQIRSLRSHLDSLREESIRLERRLKSLETVPRR
ncbi:MAG TPA: S1C family serine protease, partial [Candidatus Eisenbacteria bacterium]|nr:S1C family serine protease [Candidatus Eisenbacteria bacterium]